MAKIKICGLTRVEDIEAVNAALPDYIGFVFAKSKRQIDRETAEKLRARCRPEIQVTGVFVNESLSTVIELCRSGIIDVIQLHGDEGEEEIRELKQTVPNPVIKAIRVNASAQIEEAMQFSSDYLLFDAYHPDQYGGSGRQFDWKLFSAIKIDRPYFLAGGIHIGNIRDAVTAADPYCIDVSSGVESNGVKDCKKILDIISKIRS